MLATALPKRRDVRLTFFEAFLSYNCVSYNSVSFFLFFLTPRVYTLFYSGSAVPPQSVLSSTFISISGYCPNQCLALSEPHAGVAVCFLGAGYSRGFR